MSEWKHRKGDDYQAIVTECWLNEHGSGFWYRTAGQAGTFSEALSAGFTEAESDDFNVAVIRKGRLVAMLWMNEHIDYGPAGLREVASQTGYRSR